MRENTYLLILILSKLIFGGQTAPSTSADRTFRNVLFEIKLEVNTADQPMGEMTHDRWNEQEIRPKNK